MKITIINQHSANRGDDAQLFSSISLLNFLYKKIECINIVYNSNRSIDTRNLNQLINHFTSKKKNNFLSKIISRLIVIFPYYKSSTIENFLNIKKSLKNVNLVINAAGGSNLGVYKDWTYLARLRYIQSSYPKIKLINFGNSIESSGSYFFDYFTKITLSKFKNFIIRESISFEYASILKIKSIQSPDIVFFKKMKYLQPKTPVLDINRNFIILSLNNLSFWHPNFLSNQKIDDFYKSIIKFISKLKIYNILLIPQTYGDGSENSDSYNYYLELIKSINTANIYILNNNIGVQEQLYYFSNAHIVISSRYHSIIYASKYNIPFIPLVYENKMKAFAFDIGQQNLIIDIKKPTLMSFKNKFKYIIENYSYIHNFLRSKSQNYHEKIISNIKFVLR